MYRSFCVCVVVALTGIGFGLPGCDESGGSVRGNDAGASSAREDLTSHGSIEVVAELVEIPGLEKYDHAFPSNDLYDYAYMMKYNVREVMRGDLDRDTIIVAHYNPLKPRDRAADERCPDIGGNLRRFRAGDVHHMALEVPVDDYYMGPALNEYAGQEGAVGPAYWAVWTNTVD